MTTTESSSASTISVWDRQANEVRTEEICAEKWLRFAYESSFGRLLTNLFGKRRSLNWLAGLYFSSPLSVEKIKGFIRDQKIDMSDFEEREFNSFNDFFARRMKPGVRSWPTEPWLFPAFAEGRYLAYDKVDPLQTFPVKGHDLTARALLADGDQAEAFRGGPVLIARLAPRDYHRFHYPDSGRHIGDVDIPGSLHSVNPIALQTRSSILATNHRKVSFLTTNNFGRLAYIEVGALGVGKIRQVHDPKLNFARGDEKGYFAYGGSTVIILGQPGFWRPDDDLLEQSRQRRETFVRLGEPIASSTRRRSEWGKPVVIEGGELYRVKRG